MAENKNIKLFYEKGYITQFQQGAMFIFSRMFENCYLGGGSFDYSRLNVQTSGKGCSMTEFTVNNMRLINSVINDLNLFINQNDYDMKNVYIFLDFILLDYTTRRMKDKYKLSYKTIKDIVIVFVDKAAEIMKDKHLLNEKILK